jgi:DNA-binding MarR family transcriptional regulator
MDQEYIRYVRTTFLLRVLNNQLNTKFERATNINLSRYEILHYLVDGKEYPQSHLQAILNIDAAAITRHLKALEEEGFISRIRNPKNNRELLVRATEAGITGTLECQASRSNFDNRLFDGFEEEELNVFIRSLEKVKLNLEKME